LERAAARPRRSGPESPHDSFLVGTALGGIDERGVQEVERLDLLLEGRGVVELVS
jgi:hypothetical protein